MKILLLADPSSAHTIKWANSLNEKGLEVFLFGLSKYDPDQYNDNIQIESLKTPDKIKAKLDGNFLKIMYIAALPKLKRIVNSYKPDILHAHYVASYGVIGALTGFRPFLVSVWGIDILTFPNNSFIHKAVVKFALKGADKVLATSEYLATETKKYTNQNIQVTPFGIDAETFSSNSLNPCEKDEIIIGTVKSLERKYGIEYLIEAFSIVNKKYPEKNLKLILVGGGSLEKKFRQMIHNLGIDDSAFITGQIPYNQVVEYHNKFSIAVYVSTVESFGVSVLESSACEKPVIVSSVGGLPEVVEDGITGIIVEPRNVNATAKAIEKLVLDSSLRKQYGKEGREMVKRKYDWDNNLNGMIEIYNKILTKNL